MSSDDFYFKLAKLRLVTFLVVGLLAFLFSAWRHDGENWQTILFETAIIAFTAMFLSLPLAWIRTRLKMDRDARRREQKH